MADDPRRDEGLAAKPPAGPGGPALQEEPQAGSGDPALQEPQAGPGGPALQEEPQAGPGGPALQEKPQAGSGDPALQEEPQAGPGDPALQQEPQAGPGDPALQEEPQARPTFLGEIVQRRSWPLIAVVFLFAVFLAVVPFLFGVERSPFAGALELYDRACADRSAPADVPCVDRAAYLPRMDPVEGRQYGTRREFVVTLERRPGGPADPAAPARVRFRVQDDNGSLGFLPWPEGVPR